jgi:hypothetical protein
MKSDAIAPEDSRRFESTELEDRAKALVSLAQARIARRILEAVCGTAHWLSATSGNFILWLCVYIPGEAILKGEYIVPPVVEVS